LEAKAKSPCEIADDWPSFDPGVINLSADRRSGDDVCGCGNVHLTTPRQRSCQASLTFPKGCLMFPHLRASVVEFVRNEDGPTAVEYAVMLALIIVICLGAVSTLGAKSSGTFTSVGKTIGAS
jgi:pilus assembly protein Flp/PilA